MVFLSDSDTPDAVIQTNYSPRRSPGNMSTPSRSARVRSAPPQSLAAKDLVQTPSTPLYSHLPSELPMMGLNVSQSSVASLPVTDSAGAETSSTRSRYAITEASDTPASTPVPTLVARKDAKLKPTS